MRALPISLLLVALQATAAHSQDNGQVIDQQLYSSLRTVINYGADLYNNRDAAGCYHVFRTASVMLVPQLGHHPELQEAVRAAMTEAEASPDMARRAWVLRKALDQVRAGVKPGSKNKKAGVAKLTKNFAKMEVGQLRSFIGQLEETLAAKVQQQREYLQGQLDGLAVYANNKAAKAVRTVMMVPKMGMRLSTVAMVASRNANFTLRRRRPISVSTPLTMQMVTWPRTTPANERSSRSARRRTSPPCSGGIRLST